MELEQATQLTQRLYSYGPAAPGALVAKKPKLRPSGGSAPLHPLPVGATQRGPPLRSGLDHDAAQQPSGPDAELSSSTFSRQLGSFGGRRGLGGSASAASLGGGSDDEQPTSPMPYAKLSRNAAAARRALNEGNAAAAARFAAMQAAEDEERAEGGGASASAEDATAPTSHDPFWFIQMLKTELHEHEFAYMNVVEQSGGVVDPYKLQIVPFSQVNPSDHYTISAAGVTHTRRVGKSETSEFTPLAQWEAERAQFYAVMQIPFFKRYQVWKAHYSWRRGLVREKMSACKGELGQALFQLDPVFGTSLAAVRALCVDASALKLHRIQKGKIYTLAEFVQVQEEHKATTTVALAEFFEAVRATVGRACDRALEHFEASAVSADAGGPVATPRAAAGKAGTAAADSAKAAAAAGGGGDGVGRSFLQQAQLRSVCKRITSFIRMVDYVVLSTGHQLLMSSLRDLLTMFEEVPAGYVDATARAAALAAAEEAAEAAGKKFVRKVESPLFEVDIYYETDIAFEPARHELARAIDSTVLEFVNMLKTQVGSLLSDALFAKYTAPVINGRQDSSKPSEGLDIVGLIEENDEYNDTVDGIRASFEGHFDEVLVYCEVLQPHKALFLKNKTFDARAGADEHSLAEWRALLDTYGAQKALFEAIESQATIGIFRGNTSRLKEVFLPSPQRCLAELHLALPEIAARRTAALLNETSHAHDVLGSTPDDVSGFVSFSEFLVSTSERQVELGERGAAVQATYTLMAEYAVKARGDDVASVKMLDSQLTSLSHLVAQVESGQEERSGHFIDSIETSIDLLRTRATELFAESEDPRLFDGKTELGEALELVALIDEKFAELKADSTSFAEYQEVLKVVVTRYDEVEDLEANLRLKRNLWHGIADWGRQVELWTAAPFDELDTDLMQKEVTKYAKVCSQVEKGLPMNSVLPLLKDKVDTFKQLVPVVVAMRNDALKEHHWRSIEEVISNEIERGEGFTLGYLLELRVNEYKEEIEAVSTAASQEQILEELLAKVENMWKGLEFAVTVYKEQKDIFILGGIDDVLAVLEETQVLIQTILGSRFVGPLQKRVDEWDKKLRLFSDTLDEWLSVQRGWMYLESIFKAQDIQRQLPNEYKQFDQINKLFLDLMRKANNDPTALKVASAPKVLENLQKANATLDRIQKNLEDYLEMKRASFPRFFFLSNDELLEILAQARDPQAVQPHLIKCFDNIKKLDFGPSAASIDISAMFSQEGERVGLGKNLKARGTVEQWLGYVEEAMVKSLREEMKRGRDEYEQQERLEWSKTHVAQVVLTVAMMFWCREVEAVLQAPGDVVAGLTVYLVKAKAQLEDLARAVGGELSGLERKALVALITGDVHNRDIVSTMIEEKVDSPNSFTWAMQLRFYWENDVDDTVVRQVNTRTLYGYEYQGALSRLVVTPLTDRCWMTLTGALHVGLGGAPAGPAGTGKTESVKDLAKGIGRQCVVFNCSDQLDYKMMGKLFSGVAQTGCWTCLDEFNRIDIEVLFVVAQQLLTIRQALLAKSDRFMFEGREIKLKHSNGVFITMNPGYAGRTELPDNLKALFRPVSMMVPDYALIAEIMLFAEGFLDARSLAQKMVKMYKLCSEQLSQQDHYDYGMRQVKSVLVMSGGVKRGNPELNEDVCLIRAMQEANVPRFLAPDLPLFDGIIGDLYPGLVVPPVDYGQLQSASEEACTRAGLQVIDKFVTKVIELFQTFNVRFGVMTVGPTGGGKTACMKTLASAMSALHSRGTGDARFQPVNTYVFNPKCITMGELYGEFNALTQEWTDGIASTMIRNAVTLTTENEEYQWVVFDGPVDALWIENMNTVLDDNMTLCLANGERIKLNAKMHMLFEVQDLAVASPATVSRCGMVFLPPESLGWQPCVQSWLERSLFPATARESAPLTQELCDHVMGLFAATIDRGLAFTRSGLKELVPTVDNQLIDSLCAFFDSLLPAAKLDLSKPAEELKPVISNIYAFCFIWSVGGSIDDEHWPAFDELTRELFAEHARIPSAGDVHDYFLALPDREFRPWKEVMSEFSYDAKTPFFSMLVPTVDTVRYAYLLQKSLEVSKPMLITGHSGVGKSVVIVNLINQMVEAGGWAALPISFSAQTSARRTQESIESKLDKRKKTLLGPPPGKKMIMFVDDVNMPTLEEYGAAPPVELLRQFLDQGGFYDRQKLFWKEVADVVECCACGPPGGGRNSLTPRYVRHHSVIVMPQPSTEAMKRIFSSIVGGHLKLNGQPDIMALTRPIVESTVDLYLSVLRDLKPIPAKAHYTFNLRDVSKVVQGILMVKATQIASPDTLIKLWCHESMRVFADRFIDDHDRNYFMDLIAEYCKVQFKQQWSREELFEGEVKLVFGDYTKMGTPREDRRYEMVADSQKLAPLFESYLEEYNAENKEMRLVFFWDAIEHISRLCRVLRQPRGNAMLVGVGGSGKQSLTRFAAYVSEMKCFQIELTKGYAINEFREDLKKMFFTTGCDGTPVVFLFADTQIVVESFVEDINNILNSGEVPNLFAADEWEKILRDVRPHCKEAGIIETRDNIRAHFVDRVRENLHIVLAMSPVGNAFRVRCRMFPSLINCCTTDWFDKWPAEALQSVSRQFFEPLELGEARETILPGLCDMASTIHSSVQEMAEIFFAEQKRRFYVTPKSFLELISLYLGALDEKRNEMDVGILRLSIGTKKLNETNAMVQGMQEQLAALQPELVQKTKETNVLIEQVTKDSKLAAEKKATVAVDEAAVKKVAAEVQAQADEAQADLDAAMPALASAVDALKSLNKNDITEIKGFKSPPPLVQKVLEAVCILLGAKPDWDSAKKVMDSTFLQKLMDYDKDNIPPAVIKKIIVYYDDPEFQPEVVAKVSKAATSLCMWARAMKVYDEVAKVVEPKRKQLSEATAMLESEKAKLKKVQDELAAVVTNVEQLQATCDTAVSEKQRLTDAAETTAKRLVRAGKLTGGLADEGVRWAATVKELSIERNNLTGNVFLSAAFIAYLGFFTAPYRKLLVEEWIGKCIGYEIPTSDNYTLVRSMGEPVKIRDWNIGGLPVDEYSTENGILATKGKRWPLAIDPQGQANKWMRNMEAKNNSKNVKGNDATILRTLENAIRMGTPVILEDVGEELDPALEPVLQKQIFKQGGRKLIRVGDSDVDYNDEFRFYMTTKLPNPHYMPEVCIKVTLINFTVTLEGLEDQLLGLVVREERPDLEKAKNNLVLGLAADKKQLQELEDKILRLLSASEGNILDDEVLINTLSDSKVTSGVIQGRVKEAEETERQINETRLGYKPAATRGSILYFTIADLGNIGDMYQFSLDYFNALFLVCIQKSEKSTELERRLANVMEYASLTIYNNVSRGLFGEHKVTFSFMMTTAIMRQRGDIFDSEWALLLVGAGIIDEATLPTRPDHADAAQWVLMCTVAARVEPLRELARSYAGSSGALWRDVVGAERPWDATFPLEFALVSGWHRLLLIKCFRPEKLIECVSEFIAAEMGSAYMEQTPLDLHEVFPDARAAVPLVFVLSTGADPMSTIIRFATDVDYLSRMHAISLGQGQGPIAAALIKDAAAAGDWAVLQNCHLAKSWMPKLEKIVEAFATSDSIHPDFRLWLTSMPAKYFPVPVLQSSVKMTFEPPKGLRANLKGTWATVTDTQWGACSKPQQWHKLLFGVAFFHAVVQERRKFGPLGWNIRYEFNGTDLEMSMETLRMFLDEQDEIPWDALLYVTGEINYGGRVTDDWDRRNLMVALRRFYCPAVLADRHSFAPEGSAAAATYHSIPDGELGAVRDWVDALPYDDPVTVFGLHPNAKITFERQETDRLLDTVTSIQPRLGGGGDGVSEEDMVVALAEKLKAEVPAPLLQEEAGADIFTLNGKGELNSLQIVLLAEMGRFNVLLQRVSSSLVDLGKAIKGLVTMSADLDGMYGSMLKNQVPVLWSKVAYPSLKPLSSWIKDLHERVGFMRRWLSEGVAGIACYSLPAFFFPQGFMTGILQMHARCYAIPIDSLSFSYSILEAETGAGCEAPPVDGVYIDGFYLDGARWDRERRVVADSHPTVMYDTLPVIHFIPTPNFHRDKAAYECPLYKTAVRAGVLSTTGQSTNFVVAVDMPTDRDPDYWVSMGTAMLCALAD